LVEISANQLQVSQIFVLRKQAEHSAACDVNLYRFMECTGKSGKADACGTLPHQNLILCPITFLIRVARQQFLS